MSMDRDHFSFSGLANVPRDTMTEEGFRGQASGPGEEAFRVVGLVPGGFASSSECGAPLDATGADIGVATALRMAYGEFFRPVGDKDDYVIPISPRAKGFTSSTSLTGDMLMELSGASDEANSLDSSWPLLIMVGGCVNGRVPASPASDSFFDSVSADIERCSIVITRDLSVREVGVGPGNSLSRNGLEFGVEVKPVDFIGTVFPFR
jgi:hypothetical protein